MNNQFINSIYCNQFIYLFKLYLSSFLFFLFINRMDRNINVCQLVYTIPWNVIEGPLLLLYNGHFTHISIPVIKEALEHDAVILKIPTHVTDVLQLLGITALVPWKEFGKYGFKKESTNLWLNSVTTSRFVNKILVSAIWKEGIKKKMLSLVLKKLINHYLLFHPF